MECRVLAKRQRQDENSGVAFVHYEHSISATRAVSKMHDTMPEGCKVNMIVQFAKVHPSTFGEDFDQQRRGGISRGGGRGGYGFGGW